MRESDDDITFAFNDHDVEWEPPEHQPFGSACSCRSRRARKRNYTCFENVQRRLDCGFEFHPKAVLLTFVPSRSLKRLLRCGLKDSNAPHLCSAGAFP